MKNLRKILEKYLGKHKHRFGKSNREMIRKEEYRKHFYLVAVFDII